MTWIIKLRFALARFKSFRRKESLRLPFVVVGGGGVILSVVVVVVVVVGVVAVVVWSGPLIN